MRTRYLVAGVVAGVVAAVALSGCGGATDSDEYRELATESATTQHTLEQVQAELAKATTERNRLDERADKLQAVVDDYRSDKLVRTETNQATRKALATRTKDLDARETGLDKRERALDTRADDIAAARAQMQERAAMQDFGANGTFIVDTDMLPGDYFAPGGPDCRWAYLSGAGGGADVILSGRGLTPQYLTMSAGDVFQTKGCGPWTQ